MTTNTIHTTESLQTLIDNDNLEDLVLMAENLTGAELTNRCIPGDDNWEYPEWAERGTIGGIPVIIRYRTTPEDQAMVDDNGGDWGAVEFADRVTDIRIDYDAIEDEE